MRALAKGTHTKAAHRALGLLIAKSKCNGGMPYECFTKLYDALVLSIINYGSAIWGAKEYSIINSVHNRACRFFLGVGKYTPNAAVQGEMGWKLPAHQQWLSVTRSWCRLMKMSNTRLNKRVHVWTLDKAASGIRNWAHDVTQFYNSINMDSLVNIDNNVNVKVVLNNMNDVLHRYYMEIWLHTVNREEGRNGTRNKLRTYKLFKQEFAVEPYVKSIMNKSNRSILAKFRCGVAPIRIETGRYEKNYPPVENRTCYHCIDIVEDEYHVLMSCPVYNKERQELLNYVSSQDPTFHVLNNNNKFVYLLSNSTVSIKCAYTLKCIMSNRLHHISRLS